MNWRYWILEAIISPIQFAILTGTAYFIIGTALRWFKWIDAYNYGCKNCGGSCHEHKKVKA